MNCHIERRAVDSYVLVFDIANGGFNASHWGLTDLYDECEKNLRELLKTGVDFETEWCSSKKELLSARYGRKDGRVWVEVNQWMDDLWEDGGLIYDAVWNRFRREGIEIPDDGIEYIRQIAIECGVDDSTTVAEDLGCGVAYADVMDAVERCQNATDKELSEWYEELCDIVADYVTHEGLDKKGDAE